MKKIRSLCTTLLTLSLLVTPFCITQVYAQSDNQNRTLKTQRSDPSKNGKQKPNRPRGPRPARDGKGNKIQIEESWEIPSINSLVVGVSRNKTVLCVSFGSADPTGLAISCYDEAVAMTQSATLSNPCLFENLSNIFMEGGPKAIVLNSEDNELERSSGWQKAMADRLAILLNGTSPNSAHERGPTTPLSANETVSSYTVPYGLGAALIRLIKNNAELTGPQKEAAKDAVKYLDKLLEGARKVAGNSNLVLIKSAEDLAKLQKEGALTEKAAQSIAKFLEGGKGGTKIYIALGKDAETAGVKYVVRVDAPHGPKIAQLTDAKGNPLTTGSGKPKMGIDETAHGLGTYNIHAHIYRVTKSAKEPLEDAAKIGLKPGRAGNTEYTISIFE